MSIMYLRLVIVVVVVDDVAVVRSVGRCCLLDGYGM